MKHLISAALAVAFLLVTAPAYAWDPPLAGEPGYVAPAKPMTTHQLNVASSASAKAQARAHASATGGSVTNNIDAGGRGVTAYAPPGLALAGGGTCAGVSTSASGGGALLSLGFGRGEIDDDCTLRFNIAVVQQYDPAIAREMVKDLKGYREAAKRLGK